MQKDDGGAVIQNNTLIAIASFLHNCAVYTRAHAFPKVSSFSHWLDSVIWDENNRPTTENPPTYSTQSVNVTENISQQSTIFADPSKFMLTLPFDPVNVPLVPAEDNSVLPRMSLYESYLQNLMKSKTSTTLNPRFVEKAKKAWEKKFGKGVVMRPSNVMFVKKYENYEYN